MIMSVKRIHSSALLPTRGTPSSAGLDLYANSDAVIQPGETVKVGTGIAVTIPDGFFGGVFARSGLATKQGLRPANCVGVIDTDYRGEIIVALHNDDSVPHNIAHGDRIAQLLVLPCAMPQIQEVGELDSTGRGAGGFGSTGV